MRSPTTGTYGVLTNPPARSSSAAKSSSAIQSQPWTNSDLAVIQTELIPATLFHSQSQTLSFFTGMAETGIGGPTFVAISTQQGPKIFKPGESIEPTRMRESWFVVWFAGATNWTNWDSPWLLTLQRRPGKIRFDTNGLHFTFGNAAGYAALMPMYGYYKPAQLVQQSLPFYQTREKKKRVLTWEWFKALPADPLARARYWASVLREFPIGSEQMFSVDRSRDSVIFRQSFQWLSWNDDWETKPLKLAPVSPVLALAYKEGFPAQFSKKAFDMEIPTLHGPFYGVEGTDTYDVTLPLLQYVNETAGPGSPTGWSNAPCFDAWQQAHASSRWDDARSQWPSLRERFLSNANDEWPAFGEISFSPLAETANGLGAARLAYRLGDAETYAVACDQFARALARFIAQQRGVNYFRERQPWHSMQPLDAMPSGWKVFPAKAVVPNLPPDLARIWQDAQSIKQGATRPPAQKMERLIPSDSPTVFFPREDSAPARTTDVVHGIDSGRNWPSMTWPLWKTPSGAAWNFGQITTSTNPPGDGQTIPLNSTTRVLIYRAR